MRFTAQEEYGLRCLLQIARAPGGGLTIPEIAEREALTPAYVGKLMRVLREVGLVESTRGQKGGYRLARPPEQILLGKALAALGGRLYSKDFCGRYTGTQLACVHSVDCSIRSLWTALDAVVERALSGMTLSDLLCSEPVMSGWVEGLLRVTPALRPAGSEELAARENGLPA
jgi:Rrf2 family protein